MPSKDTKMLEFNQYRKSDKIPSIVYADLESLIKIWVDVNIILYIFKLSTTKVG